MDEQAKPIADTFKADDIDMEKYNSALTNGELFNAIQDLRSMIYTSIKYTSAQIMRDQDAAIAAIADVKKFDDRLMARVSRLILKDEVL